MSERDLALIEVQRQIKINIKNIAAATVNATMSEVNIKTFQKHMITLDKLHKEKLNRVQKQVDRYIKNLKDMHSTLDELLAEKEALHVKLKETSHWGQVQCEHCQNYFTAAGLSRHANSCIAKPTNKLVEDDKAEIDTIKDDIEARKAALKKELAEIDKKESKKPKPIIPSIEELELLAAEEATRVLDEQIARKKAGNGIQKVLDEHVEE